MAAVEGGVRRIKQSRKKPSKFPSILIWFFEKKTSQHNLFPERSPFPNNRLLRHTYYLTFCVGPSFFFLEYVDCGWLGLRWSSLWSLWRKGVTWLDYSQVVVDGWLMDSSVELKWVWSGWSAEWNRRHSTSGCLSNLFGASWKKSRYARNRTRTRKIEREKKKQTEEVVGWLSKWQKASHLTSTPQVGGHCQ